MESILKQYFGFSSFRPYQKEVAEQLLSGNDCVVVMATGSGKSLCYQLPPLVTKKTAIVISPLISLMQDQVMALKERGIKAEHLSSAQTASSVLSNAESGHYDVVYMTPEKACLLSTSFWSRLLKAGICLLAVDEAHCISEWGHDFRVEYKMLDKLREVLSNVPFVGLTATATEKVRLDIIKSLKMRDPHVAIGSFDRQNLFYGAQQISHGLPFLDGLVEEIQKNVGTTSSTIVYCTTVKDVEQFQTEISLFTLIRAAGYASEFKLLIHSGDLSRLLIITPSICPALVGRLVIFELLLKAGVKAGMYHGQMSNSARDKSHRSFIRDEFYVMIATLAFGMGIDKPDIRYVIHYGCPKSLESYYQESGRCGRDGVASVCRLYYARSDFTKADFYCRDLKSDTQRKAVMESFTAAQHFCFLTTCRRKYILNYFGENYASEECGNCDNCTSSRKQNDLSREAFLLLACIQSCRGQWGLNMPIDVLRGSRSKKILDAQFDRLPFHGLGKEMTANWWKSLADQLIANGFLAEKFSDVYRTIRVGQKGLEFLSSSTPDYQPPLYLTVTLEMSADEMNDGNEHGDLTSAGSQGLSQVEAQLYKLLLEERIKLARANGVAPYAICGDQTLKRIAVIRPSTAARLANIDGVNQHFMKVYGDHFLQAIRKLSNEFDLSFDGNAHIQLPAPKSASKVPTDRKLTPAKFEAWRMWQEDGLSIQKISIFPGRSAPIKEQTVIEYILEAARDGCIVDWKRFSEEIGLTQDVHNGIQAAVSKVGKEKLKPIKNELPDEVTYSQIKTSLAIQDMEKASDLQSTVFENNRLDLSERSHSSNAKEEFGHKVESDKVNGVCSPLNFNQAEIPVKETIAKVEVSLDPSGTPFSLSKRQKVDASGAEKILAKTATESGILGFLQNSSEGVSLSSILEQFNGSTEALVTEMLSSLESEFLIFRKDGLYIIM